MADTQVPRIVHECTSMGMHYGTYRWIWRISVDGVCRSRQYDVRVGYTRDEKLEFARKYTSQLP